MRIYWLTWNRRYVSHNATLRAGFGTIGPSMKKQRLVVGISGSSGAILGIRLLEALRATPIESHLIITPSARLTIEQETDWRISAVQGLADAYYNPHDLAAPLASGSFDTLGMVVIPCSIKSLSAIANSYSSDLLARAADVTLKEGRPLLLVLREAPFHSGHIQLMDQAVRSGAVIFPPVPAFYAHPQTVDEIVDNIVGRVLQRLGIDNDLYLQWTGLEPAEAPSKVDSEAALWALPAMTLATVGEASEPHAATVYFAAGEKHQELYFFSDAASQHSLDLALRPQAAGTIHPLATGWQDIRGLQLRGTVRVIPPGEEWDQAWARYLKKFPFTGDLKEVVARSTLYAFRADWIRWIDNRRGFGHKEEWTRNESGQYGNNPKD